MTEEIKQWEYHIQTIGNIFGTKNEQIEATLDIWVKEDWEIVNVHPPYRSGKITIVAKRPLMKQVRLMRSIPEQG